MLLAPFPPFGKRFSLGELIARGGMAAVYEAEDESGERLAAKVPYREMLANEVACERFLREASLLCRLSSPFIVRGHGVAESEDHVPMLVMDRLRGEDLASTLSRERSLPLTRAVLSVVHACVALDTLHRAGVVHRDLKPSNVFVTSAPDGFGPAVLLDLGVVKSQSEAPVTHAGCVVGSPAYMAPEQMLGQDNLDHRADVWSVGALLFELLTGEVPFPGRNIMHVLSRALFNQRRRVTAVRPDIPDLVDDVIDRCLAVEPQARFDSTLEIGRALLPVLPLWLAERTAPSLVSATERHAAGA